MRAGAYRGQRCWVHWSWRYKCELPDWKSGTELESSAMPAHTCNHRALSNPLTYTYTLRSLRFTKPSFLLSHDFLLVDWTLKMCLATFIEKHERKIYLIIYWPQGEAVVFTPLLFTTSWSCDLMVNFMCQLNLFNLDANVKVFLSHN